MGRIMAVGCVLTVLVLTGCSSVEKCATTEAGGISYGTRNHEKPVDFEPVDLEPEQKQKAEPAPPVLTLPPAPPEYRVPHIPPRPRVIGKLDVPLTRKWKYIVIHHSGGDTGNEEIFDRCHKGWGWRGVGYDFVIGNGHGSPDGAIEVTFRWEKQLVGAHAGVKEYNEHGIGICLVGNFERSYPTQKQMQSLVALVSYLQVKCHIPAHHILGHRHIKNTKCPGKNFPYYRFLSLLPH